MISRKIFDDIFQDGLGSLKVTGIVKGGMLDVNGLLHIPGHGEFLLRDLQVIPRLSNVRYHTDKRVNFFFSQ